MISASRVLVVLGAAVALGAPQGAQAQTTFSGSSNGTFNNGTTSGLTSLGGLTFGAPGTSWSFSALVGQTFTGISFGTLYLDRSVSHQYGSPPGQSFDLDLIFSQPGGGNQVFIGALSGNVNDLGNGQVNIDFNGPFTAALAGGYVVTVDVADITGNPAWTPTDATHETANVIGSLTFVSGPDGTGGTETAPEPITMVLLGSGLAGVAAARRRRKAAEAV